MRLAKKALLLGAVLAGGTFVRAATSLLPFSFQLPPALVLDCPRPATRRKGLDIGIGLGLGPKKKD